jgi:hypothetical protein
MINRYILLLILYIICMNRTSINSKDAMQYFPYILLIIVLLGPDRFRLINNAARNLIEDVNRRVGSGNGALDVTRTRAVQGNNKKK